jgi:MFS family permease
MVYYATIILSNVGLSSFNSQLIAASMQTFFAIGTWPLPRTIELFGRRKIMMWTAFVCSISLLVFVIMIGLPNPSKAMQWTAVAAVFVWEFSFGYGWAGVPWVYSVEVGVPCSRDAQ